MFPLLVLSLMGCCLRRGQQDLSVPDLFFNLAHDRREKVLERIIQILFNKHESSRKTQEPAVSFKQGYIPKQF